MDSVLTFIHLLYATLITVYVYVGGLTKLLSRLMCVDKEVLSAFCGTLVPHGELRYVRAHRVAVARVGWWEICFGDPIVMQDMGRGARAIL